MSWLHFATFLVGHPAAKKPGFFLRVFDGAIPPRSCRDRPRCRGRPSRVDPAPPRGTWNRARRCDSSETTCGGISGRGNLWTSPKQNWEVGKIIGWNCEAYFFGTWGCSCYGWAKSFGNKFYCHKLGHKPEKLISWNMLARVSCWNMLELQPKSRGHLQSSLETSESRRWWAEFWLVVSTYPSEKWVRRASVGIRDDDIPNMMGKS